MQNVKAILRKHCTGIVWAGKVIGFVVLPVVLLAILDAGLAYRDQQYLQASFGAKPVKPVNAYVSR